MSACTNLATTVGNIIEFIYLYKTYRRNLPEIKEEISESINTVPIRIYKIIKEIIRVAIPISITALIMAISKNIDSTTIVSELKDIIGYEEAKKEYGILSGKVDALINFPLSFNMAIGVALLPSIASANGNIKSKEKRINESLLLEMIIAIPITSIFIMYADEILKILFPNATNGAMILKVSSISIIFVTIEQITNNIFHAIGKTSIPIKAVIVGVIAKAILNKVLVPRIDLPLGGTIGAGLATVICHCIASIYSLIMLIKITNIKISLNNIIKPTFASIVLIAVSKIFYFILNNKISNKIIIIISLILGTCAYLVCLKLLNIFNKKDIELIIKNKK